MDLILTTTSTDVAARTPSIAVLPIGSFEQHSSFLPLATDKGRALLASLAESFDNHLSSLLDEQ
ncbi:creatininase family protein [Micromonospora sp. Llam7]|uniref:creatininase family protein n=1 Tax=Micromonospora tarapacensis TaxID=2835305 RepID=UPI001C83DD4E|nr:creatininase family protein [Micromonospora tarapacensis]MBX7268870.1 creatininase family protein [Micromonospora tarapacensis]